MGPVTVDADVSVEDIEQGIERLAIMGPVICPDNVVSALRSKTEQQMGPVTSYPAGTRLVSIMGTFRLDHDALATLEDGTALNVAGRLTVPEPLPADLLARKVLWLSVEGGVRCHEENASFLRALMPDPGGTFTLLPAGVQGHRASTRHRQHIPSVRRRSEDVRGWEDHRRSRRHLGGDRPEYPGAALRRNDRRFRRPARLAGPQVRPGAGSGAVLRWHPVAGGGQYRAQRGALRVPGRDSHSPGRGRVDDRRSD